jgi:glycosyltransferase involved in cell wall biosynthesis
VQPKPVIALVSNSAWSIFRFRLGLARHLKSLGFEVLLIAPSDPYAAVLIRENFTFEALEMRPHRASIGSEISVLWQLYRIYRRYRPKLIFHYTIKPNIYGSVAAQRLGIPSVAIVTGLGQLLSRRALWKQWLLERMYEIGCANSRSVWFLNHEDKTIFCKKKIVNAAKTHIIPSEGIDTNAFSIRKKPPPSTPTFLFVGRLLREKGILQYVEAAKRVREKHPETVFQILGFIDPENTDSVTHSQVKMWMLQGWIDYLGESDDVQAFLNQCSCVVLPTYYREGIPRILLEAGSMAIPVIASDSVGCRDVVEHNVNGLLCLPQSVEALVEAMENFLQLSQTQQQQMGLANHEVILAKFTEKQVIAHYLDILNHYQVTPDPIA